MAADGGKLGSVSEPTDRRAWTLMFGAWVIALVSTLGALFIGEVLGQTPCQLCWYQRIAMFPLALILGIACLNDDVSVRRYVIPIALAGAGIAMWHTLLYFGVISASIVPCDKTLSCTGASMTIFGWVPIPFLSLVAFVLILVLSFPTPSRREQ